MNRKYKIGIANLSAYVSPKEIDTARNILLKLFAYEVVLASNIHKRHYFYSGNERARIEGLLELLEYVDIVIFARGGYGAVKTLKYLNTDIILRSLKPMIGMSDLTSFFIYLYQNTGKICFHGPNLVSEFLSPHLTENKIDMLNKLSINSGSQLFTHDHRDKFRVLSEGRTQGRLIGGNLSTISSMIGTPHISPFSDHILFIEDTGERPYRVDRMLTQCLMSGLFDGIRGVLIGDFTNGVVSDEHHLFDAVFMEHFSNKGLPVICNIPFGHGSEKITIPIGALVDLDTGTSSVELCEDIHYV